MSEVIIKKPVSMLNKDLKLDFKKFFISSSKSAIGTTAQVAMGNPMAGVTASKGIIDIVNAVGLGETVEETAWILVVQAVTRAITATVEEYRDIFIEEVDDVSLNTIAEEIENQINSIEVVLNSDFFDNAKNLPFIEQLQPILIDWLKQLHLDEYQANGFFNQFTNNVVIAFHEEWSSNTDKYANILNSLTSPFLQASSSEKQLVKYRLWLQQEVNKRMFEESFGLSDIYISLNAYYECDDVGKENSSEFPLVSPSSDIEHLQKTMTKKVCQIHDEIESWLMSYDANDTLKVISGGPGSGKSSFAKMLASDLASKVKPVLFIPLHRLKLERYLYIALEEYIKISESANYLSPSILQQSNLLIIFDGLDELSMQSGDSVKETAKDFVDEVKNLLRDNKEKQWKAIITGREIAVQTQKNQFKKNKNIYYLMPYFVDKHNREEFSDDMKLLELDKRHDWWKKLAKLKGLNFTKLPKEIATEHLQPITQEPLLNYLLSLSYLNQKIKFDNDTNLNQIYADLLASVHERKYANSRKYQSTDEIDKDDFERILQEIALAVWHNNGRNATLKQITEQCNQANLTTDFDIFKQDAQSGVIKLLMAFYFREFGSQQSDKTFEFTHKSFGEYLTARRIIKEIQDIFDEYQFNYKKRGEATALENAFESWIELFGKQGFYHDIGNFIVGELKVIANQDDGLKTIENYQTLLVDLINMAIDNKTPVKKLGLASFAKDLAYKINSESAMLQMHSYCGELTNKRIKKIQSNEGDEGVNNWIHSLNEVALERLNHLIVTNTYFKGTFINTNFSDSDMTMVNFNFSNICGSSFNNTILNYSEYFIVSLFSCNFNLCDMNNFSFSYSYLTKINMRKISISNSIFRYTSIIDSNFEDVNFINVQFAASKIDQKTINNFKNVTFKDSIVTDTLLANEPEAITDAEGIVRLTKVFNPS